MPGEAVHDETDGTAVRRDGECSPPVGALRPHVWVRRSRPAGTLGRVEGRMHRAFTIASDPRSWRSWSALAALVAVLSAVLPGVAAAGGQQLPAFWVLLGVMAVAGRHSAPGRAGGMP